MHRYSLTFLFLDAHTITLYQKLVEERLKDSDVLWLLWKIIRSRFAYRDAYLDSEYYILLQGIFHSTPEDAFHQVMGFEFDYYILAIVLMQFGFLFAIRDDFGTFCTDVDFVGTSKASDSSRLCSTNILVIILFS